MNDDEMNEAVMNLLSEQVCNEEQMNKALYSSACTSTYSNQVFSRETLEKAMVPLLEALRRPDEMVVWMRKVGCDPDVGWVLMVPPKYNSWFPFDPPSYVRISQVVPEPCLIFAPQLNPPRLKPIKPLKYTFDWRF